MLRRAFALSLALHGLGFAAMIALEGEPEPHARRPAAALAPAPPSVPVGAPQAHPVAVQRITILTAGKPSAPPSKLAAAPSRAPTRNVAPALAREPEGDAAPAEPTVRHTDGSVLGDAAYATWYRAVVDQIRALPDARAPGDGWWRVRLVMDAQGALLYQFQHGQECKNGMNSVLASCKQHFKRDTLLLF